jgi:alcohol dehydrogenase
MKMKAAVIRQMGLPQPYAKSQPLVIEEVDLDKPGERELLVQVKAAGLCHSDLSTINADRPRQMPMVLGHEAAGVVVECGPGVHDLKPGDHVVMVFAPSCGECISCQEGHPGRCEPGQRSNGAGKLLGDAMRLSQNGQPVYHHVGVSAFAEYCTVNRGSVVKIDDELPFDEAALFGCAVLTGVGAALNTAQVFPGSRVAVVGLGGVGLNALLGAQVAGASQVIALDVHDDKLALAKKLGATDVVNAKDSDAIQKVKDLTRGGVDFGFEMAGSVQAMELAYRITRRRHHRHRRPAAPGCALAAAACQPHRRGTHGQGQLCRLLRPAARPAAVRRAVSQRHAAGEPADERSHPARADQRGLRPARLRAYCSPDRHALRKT